jgi:hypothetical protein
MDTFWLRLFEIGLATWCIVRATKEVKAGYYVTQYKNRCSYDENPIGFLVHIAIGFLMAGFLIIHALFGG